VSETELLLPDGLDVQSAWERISVAVDGMEVERFGPDTMETDRVFYDTFDGRLRAAGASAVYQDGRFGFGTLEVDAVRPPQRVLATNLEPGPLRDALGPIVDVRALLPLAQVHVKERHLRVLDGERKTVVRVTLEEPVLVDADVERGALAPRLRLVAVRGYDRALVRVQDALEHELGVRAATVSLVDEAVLASGGTPGGFTSKIEVSVGFEERADAAVVNVLQALVGVVRANLEGTIEDLDSEFLHDLRVAVRRTRSVQREFKHVFPPRELQRFRAEFRWLQQLTGDARDIDVYVLEFDSMRRLVPAPMRSDLDQLLELLRKRRLKARERMVDGLRSERFTTLLDEWCSFLAALPESPRDQRPDGQRPIGRLAGERMLRVYRRMVRMGRAIDQYSPATDYHELRKKGKELRYMLELFGGPLYPAEIVKPMIKALKALQDVLGRHQDREVQAGTLRSIGGEIGGSTGFAPTLMAMGALVARLNDDARSARAEFSERFEAFASEAQRTRIKDTFA
jgi:CHAD domain-containing protein